MSDSMRSEFGRLSAKIRWGGLTRDETKRHAFLAKHVRFKPKIPLSKRFWDKVAIGSSDSCWEWKACRHYKGYGSIAIGGGKCDKAHRVSYELSYGPIPTGMCVCHRCDNPPCCNPKHLFLGTPGENTRDAVKKGRFVSTKRGETHGSAKLKELDVLQMRSLVAAGISMGKLAKAFRVSKHTVMEIALRRTWKHI